MTGRHRGIAMLRRTLRLPGRQPQTPVAMVRRHDMVMTDALTGTEHRMTDEAFAAGRAQGRYLAICGAPMSAASLTAPQRSRCPECEQGA